MHAGASNLRGCKINFRFQGPEMPRSIALRDALEVDIPLIEMWAQAIDSGQYMSRHLPQLLRTLLWKIIIVDGTDIGTTWIERREGIPDAVFLGIFIGQRSALGKGIGRAAITALIDEVWRIFGDVTIRLHVRQSNARAIACY